MISVQKALSIIQKSVREIGSEAIALDAAAGRVLAEDVLADMDLPPFDRSQMDGFAVRSRDIARAPVTLRIVGESIAGKRWRGRLERGQAVRIMTGAPFPEGADTVVKVELTDHRNAGHWSDKAHVEIFEPVARGTSIVRRGSEVRSGIRLLSSGDILNANNIAVPAAFGYRRIRVGKRPRVAIMSTGSEIVDIARKPGPDQIRNSNSIMLRSLAEAAGARAEIMSIARDDIGALREAIARALKVCDLLIVTGGVSVGKYDLTKPALIDLGAEIAFEKVRLKPGKPTVFARLGKTFIFGLPGNPVSAAVTFYLFVRTALLQMQGSATSTLRQGSAVLKRDARGAKERATYLPARLTTSGAGSLETVPLSWQGSSDLIGFAGAQALICLPAGSAPRAGEVVRIAYL